MHFISIFIYIMKVIKKYFGDISTFTNNEWT